MTFTKEQLIEHAKRRLNYSRCGCRVSDSDRALDEALIETALDALESRADAEPAREFLPKNLDRALGVVGVALPESREEFNLQSERWIQRLIDRVIRYADEFKEQPAPVVPQIMHSQGGTTVYADYYAIGWNACRAAMLQGKAEQPHSTQQTGWTGNSDADAALVMLDRIDTLDSADDARIEDIKRIIRTLAERPAEPVSQPYTLREWIPCSERMPDPNSKSRVCVYTPTPHEDLRYRFVPAALFKTVCRDATHWQYMTSPAAPQQEAE